MRPRQSAQAIPATDCPPTSSKIGIQFGPHEERSQFRIDRFRRLAVLFIADPHSRSNSLTTPPICSTSFWVRSKNDGRLRPVRALRAATGSGRLLIHRHGRHRAKIGTGIDTPLLRFAMNASRRASSKPSTSRQTIQNALLAQFFTRLRRTVSLEANGRIIPRHNFCTTLQGNRRCAPFARHQALPADLSCGS